MERFASAVAKFDGRILQRGFWLYVWTVSNGRDEVLYVGRTGDSSSHFASSPFSRLGQHLDLRPNAKGNALLKNLRAARLDPVKCTFDLFAIGPLFLEQSNLERHRQRRDIVAPLENALAVHLRDAGYRVIGMHGSRKEVDRKLFTRLLAMVNERFPKRPESRREPQ